MALVEFSSSATIIFDFNKFTTKADIITAEEYSELCLSEETRKRVFNMVRDEYKRTLELTLKVAQMNTLLDDNPALSVSLMRRDPYLDPLSHIQIKLLKH